MAAMFLYLKNGWSFYHHNTWPPVSEWSRSHITRLQDFTFIIFKNTGSAPHGFVQTKI